MSERIPKTLRKEVAKRADYQCEYCRMHESHSFLPFQIDHIVSQKHGGGNEFTNLAYACPHCNQHKGSDLTTFLDSYEDIEVLYNPRFHEWEEHFSINVGEIRPQTRIGKATVKLLRLNEPERLVVRKILMEKGLYP